LSATGLISDTVDTQDVTLTNVTDGLKYSQLRNVIVDIDRNVTKHQLTNDTIDNVYSLIMNSIQGNILLTTPEIVGLVALAISLDNKVWKVTYANANGVSTLISFEAQLKTFRPEDNGERGPTEFFFRLEATEVVSVA